MKIIKYILSKPYLFFAIYFIYNLNHIYILWNRNIVTTILFHLFYIPWILFLFWIINRRLTNIFAETTIKHETVRGYMFLLTYAFPWFAFFAALISKIFKINDRKKLVYVDQYGNTVTKVQGHNPMLVYKKDKGDEEEIIVMTKYKRKKGV